MPYISSIERIGREEGFQEGVLQGEQKGQARMFLRFLHRRFGFVPQWIEDKVYQADGATLLLWGDRLMDAERLESIFQ